MGLTLPAHAVVATAPNRVEYLPVQIPSPGPGDVLVRTQYSWISNGTDASFVRGERIAGDTPRRPEDPLPFPHVPGYQKTGIIESVGSEVEGLHPGDRVFVSVSGVNEMFYPTGGHISLAVAPAHEVWKLPDSVSSLAASGLVLTQVGYNCGLRPTLNSGDAAIVLGDGLVGHWAAQTLSHRGARVLLSGRHDTRLALSGAKTVNTRHQDLLTVAREWAPDGVQAVIDTVGSISALESLYPALKHEAHLVSAGFQASDSAIDTQRMRELELTLHAPAGWTRQRMNDSLQLLSEGHLQTEPFITHHFPASEAAAAFDLILSRREPFLGVILDWTS